MILGLCFVRAGGNGLELEPQSVVGGAGEGCGREVERTRFVAVGENGKLWSAVR